jgi:serine/threonine protein kinase
MKKKKRKSQIDVTSSLSSTVVESPSHSPTSTLVLSGQQQQQLVHNDDANASVSPLHWDDARSRFWQGSDDWSKHFIVLRKVGHASRTDVFTAVHDAKGGRTCFAVKMVRCASETFGSSVRQCLRPLWHENVMPVYGCTYQPGSWWVLTAHAAQGSLRDVVGRLDRPLNEREAAAMARPLLRALAYLAERGQSAVHPLSVDSILFTSSGHLYVSSSSSALLELGGGAASPSPAASAAAGAAAATTTTANKEQVYRLGALLVELVDRAYWHALPEDADRDALLQLRWLAIHKKYSHEFVGFIDCCLQQMAIRRPSPAELLAHPYVTSSTSLSRQVEQDILARIIAEQSIDGVDEALTEQSASPAMSIGGGALEASASPTSPSSPSSPSLADMGCGASASAASHEDAACPRCTQLERRIRTLEQRIDELSRYQLAPNASTTFTVDQLHHLLHQVVSFKASLA